MNTIITLFDNNMNYIQQADVTHIVKDNHLDERNLVKSISKFPKKNVKTEITIDESNKDRASLMSLGLITRKIGNCYYSIQDIEVRDTEEKEMPFSDGSAHDILIYTNMHAHAYSNDDSDAEPDFEEEKKKYIEKYSHMNEIIYKSEARYNYYENPRINDTKAKASYAAAYEVSHNGKKIPWMPVRDKDATKLITEMNENMNYEVNCNV